MTSRKEQATEPKRKRRTAAEMAAARERGEVPPARNRKTGPRSIVTAVSLPASAAGPAPSVQAEVEEISRTPEDGQKPTTSNFTHVVTVLNGQVLADEGVLVVPLDNLSDEGDIYSLMRMAAGVGSPLGREAARGLHRMLGDVLLRWEADE